MVAFTPNSRLFGRVIGTGCPPSRWSRSPSTTARATRHPGVLDALREAGARPRSSSSAATCTPIPSWPAGSWTRGTSSRATATTTAARRSRPDGDRAPVRATEDEIAEAVGARRHHSSALPTASAASSCPGRAAGRWIPGRRLDEGASSTPPSPASSDRGPLRQHLHPARSCCCTMATAAARATTAPRPWRRCRGSSPRPESAGSVRDRVRARPRAARRTRARFPRRSPFAAVLVAVVVAVSQRFELGWSPTSSPRRIGFVLLALRREPGVGRREGAHLAGGARRGQGRG